MSDLNAHDYLQSTPGPAYIPPTSPKSHITHTQKIDESGASTIEQSEMIKALMIAAMGMPILLTPIPEADNKASNYSGNIAALKGIQIAEIKEEILDSWQKNLEEIQEQVAELVNSPAYQALMYTKIHGSQNSGSVSGVQAASSANAASANPIAGGSFDVVSAVEIARQLQKVQAADQKGDSKGAELAIPLMAVVFIGGALAIGGLEMTTSVSGMSSNPLQGAMEIIDKLQPSLSVLSMEQIVPMINLMVMAPIYYNAWTEAVSRQPNKESNNLVKTAQKYAQDAIKMVSNPDYVMATFVSKMEGAEQLGPAKREEIATVMRLILATVALSLLYSVETGKAQSDKFWGIEPQELRDILNGTLAAPDASKKPTVQEKLSSTLISLIQAQLSALATSTKAQVVDAILSYVSSSHSIGKMLDPAKVLNDVFNSMEYDAEEARTVDKLPA